MIFTDRTITVRKGESRIDEPIVVYRGDYELEVRFTILNSRFKFMSGTNMIESEKASYGQLAILTPYGGNIFSDIVRCNDGSVTFVLTADMLNQIEEVGLYSFQIRLMDYNKESRVSIPPIEFGIEVREPIASEDHDNSANNAIVGYSIAKVVDPKEENVGDTFDDNGNYNKTKWETGDRISEGKLNKIEDAIDKINRNEKDNTITLSKRIDNNFNVLDSIKAESSDMANIQMQVNDLVLGAIGDGNNAEVVQSRAGYTLLNDRLTVISEAATKCDKFGYIDLSNPDFVSSTKNRIVCNCIPITSKGSVVVKYVPKNSYVFIQHLRYNSDDGVFNILSSVRVKSTTNTLNTTVCNFKINPSGYDYIAVEGLGFSRNLSNPGYMFLSDSLFESDQSQTEYVKTLTINPEASFAYYVEVYSTNDTELKREINEEIDNIANRVTDIESHYMYLSGYERDTVDVNMLSGGFWDQSKVKVDRRDDWGYCFYSESKITVAPGETYHIKNIVGSNNLHPILLGKSGYNEWVYVYPSSEPITGTVTYDEITLTIPDGVDFMCLNTTGKAESIQNLSVEKILNPEYKFKEIPENQIELNEELLSGIDNITNRVSDIENNCKYAIYDMEKLSVSMLSGGFWNHTKVKVDKSANWGGYFYSESKISVAPGETYYIKNIVGTNNLHPILLGNNSSTGWVYVYPSSEPITGTVRYDEIVLTIPDGVDFMCLNTTGKAESIQNLSVEKMVNVEYKFKEIPENQIELNEELLSGVSELEFEINSLKNKCTKYDNFDFTWKSFDKVYFAITIDDSNSALGDFYDVAHSRGIPISTACVASKLNSGVSGGRTIREINNLIVADGGEILAHYSGSPTDNTSYEDWLELTRTPKKILMEEGWVIRGLIRADSTPHATSKGERVCREYYDYSDNVGKSAQYNMGSRKFLIGVKTLDEFKTWVDTCCNTPGFYPICVHGLRDDEPLATKENLALILDYISSKNNTVFTTYAEMFDKFGTTTIEKKIDLL